MFIRSPHHPGPASKPRAASMELIERRMLMTNVYPDMSTSAIQSVINNASGGETIFFVNHPQNNSTPQAYVLTDRVKLKSGDSTSGAIIYEGYAAAYDSGTGAVTDPGTVITDTNSTDHFAFGIGSSTDHSQQSYITIQNLTFNDCGVASLDAPVDHLDINHNLIRNDVSHSGNTPEWNRGGAIHANHGVSDSTIDYNVFKDNQIAFGVYFPYEGGTPVYNNFHVDHNTFSNVVGGIHGELRGDLHDNKDDTFNYNVGIGLQDKLIEIQGEPSMQDTIPGAAENLDVSYNMASGFVNLDDSTMGISVPLNGDNVIDMKIRYNEISGIPGDGTPQSDSHPGVRNGLEIGGVKSTATDASSHGAIIQGNRLWGMVTPISLTGHTAYTHIVDSDKDIVYWSGSSANSYGVSEDQVTMGTIDYSGAHTADQYQDLPDDVSVSGYDNTVAFDAWVSGSSSVNAFEVDSDRTIKKGGSTVGTIPDTSGFPGLGKGQAVIDGKTGEDTYDVDGARVEVVKPPISTLSITGNGRVTVAGHPTVNDPAGTVTIASANLTIDSGSVLDMRNNSLIVDYTGSTPIDTIRQHLQNHRLVTSAGTTANQLGYQDNGSSILIKYTYGGDANLDGLVNVTDLGAVATNWQTSQYWTGGDFSYDKFVDVTDLGIIATNWQAGVNPASEQSFQDAWDEARGNGFGENDDGITAEQWEWLLSIAGTNAGGPTL